MGASEQVPVEREDVLVRGGGRPPGGAEMGASERVPVELYDVDLGLLPLPRVLDRARVPGCSVTRDALPKNRGRAASIGSSESVNASTKRRRRV